MLSAHFRRLNKKRQVRLLEMEPALWIIVNAPGDLACRCFRGKLQQQTCFDRRLQGKPQTEQLSAFKQFVRENRMKGFCQSRRITGDKSQGCLTIECLETIEKLTSDLQVRFQSKAHTNQFIDAIGHTNRQRLGPNTGDAKICALPHWRPADCSLFKFLVLPNCSHDWGD